MSDQFEIDHCEVCGSKILAPLLDLGMQPLCDDLVPIGSQEVAPNYPLRLVGCETCNTVHQAVQVPKKLLFPQTYHYRSALTQDVLDGMSELVQTVTQHAGSCSGKTVLDIGCNDGSLLGKFKAEGARTFGIEPTRAALDAKETADWVHHGFFDRDAVETYLQDNPKPDVITFTNVFAHIENLAEVLDNLLLIMSDDTKLVIENHYLGAVAERAQFDTFYHEHPRTYSYKSFEYIAKTLGRNIEQVEFPERYNGNIRVIIGKGAAAQTPDIDEGRFIEDIRNMHGVIDNGRDRIVQSLHDLRKEHGPLVGKAFPGRASILVHCLGIDENLIATTYERSNSKKLNHYVPGTKIEIRDEREFLDLPSYPPVMINFAWHIQAEISRYMKAQGFTGEVIPLWQ